jgi:ribosomal peptide maturation radical SAM protein 1
MFRICLVNMPFSNLALPSIALTQIKSVVDAKFKDKVAVDIQYLSHDVAKFLNVDFYGFLATSMESLNTGLGDWLFRQAAFPELPDNTEKYFERYFPTRTTETELLKKLIRQKRPGLDALLDELIERYDLASAQVVGFTSMFMQNTANFALARKLKKLNPALLTVMGGANCEFPMGGVIAERCKEIDFVFSGPALRSFPDFIGYCLNGEISKASSIRGVFAAGTRPNQTGPATIGDELDISTPVDLNYASFMRRLEEYFPNREVKPVLTLETSRGCWWGERAHCTFCGLNGVSMGYRSAKPELAIELFNSLFQYSGKVTRLMAVDNILPKSYFQEVLPFLNTPSDMEIFYEVKADLSEQDMAALAKAGVKQIQPGIEALATPTLKLMKKGTTVFQNLKLLKLCALYSIQPHWNLLLGFPGEGEASYRIYVESIPRLLHLHPPSGAYPVRFDRFSPYHDQAEKYGLDLLPLDFYSLIYPFEKADLEQFAYYFADQNLRAEYFITMAKWIGKVRASVAQWQKRWNESRLPPPRLHFKGNSQIIYDSRSGSIIEHHVGEIGLAILKHLTKPTRTEELFRVFPEGMVAEQIAKLQEYGLLFQEDDRLFSLVLEDEHGSRTSCSVPHSVMASQPGVSVVQR